ncbi:MAG: metal-dependent transcriptional regulator [Actinomycetota bacterium]|nr:metal-dependent transcriptional regulator [Actinomycetota bacterium]MEE2645837.1 metal-dependent transcriptional regulator [Actinomycetota bacterium]|tara:strand:- start:859 stop:1527 length:669 start_codon:yes stop_codon:yes gene_type:complete
MAYESPEYHPAFEEYCETIFELDEDGVDVIQARIVERLQVSRPAVSEMIKKMGEADLIYFHGTKIHLTEDGKNLANQVVRRHRLAERFLTDVLGLSWAEAHHEAGRWEHVISPSVEDAFLRILEDPTTCPHGNPIPGTDYQMPEGASALSDIEVGNKFIVERIPEELEFQPGLLEFLEESNLIPGENGKVTAVSPDGTTTVEVKGTMIGVGAFASQRILVTT